MSNEITNLFNIPTLSVEVDSIWLFKHNMGNNYYNSSILVKMIAIDCFYKKNDYGFNWYNKMQLKRVKDNPMIPKYMAYHENEFRDLIKSFEENGFDSKKPIILNKDFYIVDGTHRLALALYMGIKRISIKIDEKSYYLQSKDFSINWFKNNGMAYVEKEVIKKYNEVLKGELDE